MKIRSQFPNFKIAAKLFSHVKIKTLTWQVNVPEIWAGCHCPAYLLFFFLVFQSFTAPRITKTTMP